MLDLCPITTVWSPVMPQVYYSMHMLTALIIERLSCPLLNDAIESVGKINSDVCLQTVVLNSLYSTVH